MQKLLVIGFIIGLTACKKDIEKTFTPSTAPSTTYSPMTTGSYWVYDWYVIDSAGIATPYPATDSIYIVGDTIIGGNTFSIQAGTWYGISQSPKYFRDSIGYLINETGRIFFSANNYTDTLYTWNSGDGTVTGYLKMNNIGAIVTVPAGTFPTLNAEYTIVNNIGTWPCLGTLDVHNNRHAINIGEVNSSFQFTGDATCKVYERRLRTYFIN